MLHFPLPQGKCLKRTVSLVKVLEQSCMIDMQDEQKVISYYNKPLNRGFAIKNSI